MFEELRKSQWIPVMIVGLGVWVFVTIEAVWMLSLKG